VTHPDFDHATATLVRAADAEVVGFLPHMVRLLADSSSTGGRLSAQRVTLADGADGANPHHHADSAELFYVLSGSAQLLAGDHLQVAGEGDLAVVPPGLPHAFAAVPGSDADLLIVITPGVERFEYFRHLARIATGQQPPESLLEVQARYDTYFDRSPIWQQKPKEPTVSTFATIAALTGVLAAGIIYGTDVFCALVQRPALAMLDDATVAAAMGRVHQARWDSVITARALLMGAAVAGLAVCAAMR
jgi:quercetin dioxygenase-like cupin family protein